MNLSENIFKCRTRLGLSQGDLANALEVSRQSVSKWENNAAVPELDKLVKMSELFDISLDELVFRQERPHYSNTNLLPNHPPMRITIGLILLLFGLVGFLLSVFWGDHLRVGEEIGEVISLCVVVVSVALLAADNFKALAICAVTSFLYSLVSFGFLNIINLPNYLFVFLTNSVIMIWFIRLGLRANKGSEQPCKT